MSQHSTLVGLDYSALVVFSFSAFSNSISYSNRSESIFLGSKIESQNFTMGFGYWHKKEGVGGWTNDQIYINNTDITSWNPYNAFIYAKYDKALGSKEKLYFSNFS